MNDSDRKNAGLEGSISQQCCCTASNAAVCFMPQLAQALDGKVTISLGAKGDVEVDLVSGGERCNTAPFGTITW
jgi:hypothetical protein